MKSIFFILTLLGCWFRAQAQTGQPDPSFGRDGSFYTYAAVGFHNGFVVQPDGKILVAGKNGLARYYADGTLDNSFSGDGFQPTGFIVAEVTLQADGKIVVVGTSADDFAVARFNSDGSVDNSFSGDGVQVIDYAVNSVDDVVSLVIQTDGKIIVAGRAQINNLQQMVLVRLNGDGSLDNTYGGSGKVNTGLFFDVFDITPIVLQSDGKLVAVGTSPQAPRDFAVMRYNVDGFPDQSFGIAGISIIDFGELDIARSVAVQNDGKIVIAGTLIYLSIDEPDACVARLNVDGSLDSKFSGDGKAIVVYPFSNPNYNDGVNVLAIQADGKIILGGTLLVRFNADGELDDSFGIGGIQSSPMVKKMKIFDNKLYVSDGLAITRYFLTGINIQITSPSSFSVFDSPGPVTIKVSASSPAATIEKVELYNGTTLVGTDVTSPYEFSFSNVLDNTDHAEFYLTAKATDNAGNVATSAAPFGLFEQLPKPVTVPFLYPYDNTSFPAPASITLETSPYDASYYSGISKVEYFNGNTFLGTGYHDSRHRFTFIFAWNNIPEGVYTITAKATNSTGRTGTSEVHVFIGPNRPPQVNLYTPSYYQAFMPPANITMLADASDDDGIEKVEFYNGTNLLGTSTSPPYTFTWKNVPVGNYTLTARATDNAGISVPTSPRPVSVVIPEIVSFTLVDAGLDKSIQPLTDGIILDRTLFPRDLNIRANPNLKRVGSVVFILDGVQFRLENGPPYALAGDYPSGDYHAWRLPLGTHTLTAIPYSKSNAKGIQGQALTIHFTVIEPSANLITESGITLVPFEIPRFNIYPNPAKNILFIYSEGIWRDAPVTLSVINVSGIIVKKLQLDNPGKTIQLNVSSLLPGIYFIKMESADKVNTKLFVKL